MENIDEIERTQTEEFTNEKTKEVFRILTWTTASISNKGKLIKTATMEEIPTTIDEKGVRRCELTRKDGTVKRYSVAWLVLKAFKEPVRGDCFVNYLNGDLSDCRLENLEWVKYFKIKKMRHRKKF